MKPTSTEVVSLVIPVQGMNQIIRIEQTNNLYYIEDSSLEYLYHKVKNILSVHTLLHCYTNHRGQMEKEDTASAYNEIGAGSFVPTLIPSFPMKVHIGRSLMVVTT